MTLVEHLEQSGVRLGQKVGVIVESNKDTGTWCAVYARFGKVLKDVPINVAGQPEVADYDPEYDILVLWQVGEEQQLHLLRMVTDSSLYSLDSGGIMIDKPDTRIHIGQSKQFMDSVCEIMCTLS